MNLNWAERLVVNNPFRVFEQRFELGWMTRCMKTGPCWATAAKLRGVRGNHSPAHFWVIAVTIFNFVSKGEQSAATVCIQWPFPVSP
jgi:hypothetical protein